MNVPRIVIAGTSSGAGKTSITCGIIYGLRERGLTVQPFKVGPDYIDPAYLSAASSGQARNLDVWMMGRGGVLASLARNSRSDISVIEGVMGYYDGHDAATDHASTHHVAEITRSPAILVLDASSAARSVAATALGFVSFHKRPRIAGIILNRLGSKRHEAMCRQALAGLGVPIVGAVPRMPQAALESRHLGLLSTLGTRTLGAKVMRTAKAISEHIDVGAILAISSKAPQLPKPAITRAKNPKVTIAVALDSSFNFYYRDNLELLERSGAAVKFFSPASGKRVPRCDGLYIGGGFPEVLGARLARNGPMKRDIRRLAEDGMPLYAECGGLMYLTKSIREGKQRHRMVGLYDAETEMTPKPTLGYTSGTASGSVLFGGTARVRGHEFHYSKLACVPQDSRFAYRLDAGAGIRDGRDGLLAYGSLASYGHLYFAPSHAESFIQNCAIYSRS